MCKKVEPIIDMHDTWLVLNSVQGCTNGCKYCFLQGIKRESPVPIILATPKEAIEMLLSSKYYTPEKPLCLFPGTDIFLNQTNIDYLKEILKIVITNNIPNTLVIITKCLIPNDVISLFKDVQRKGNKIVVYLSYSGLGKEYEPNIDPNNLIANFKNLHKENIPVIHYYRPFLKVNSKAEKITEMLDFVHQYTDVSVITGLKVRNDFIDKLSFEEITKLNREACLNASCVWPKESYNYFFKNYNHPHNVFQTNYCALAQVLKEPCPEYYDTFECHNYNHCSEEQRQRCKNYQKQEITIEKIIEYISKLGYNTDSIEIKINGNNIILRNSELKISDVAYLTKSLKHKISLEERSEGESHFSSSMTNSEPFIY